VNPLLSKEKIACPHLTRSGGFRLTNTIKAHALAVSGYVLNVFIYEFANFLMNPIFSQKLNKRRKSLLLLSMFKDYQCI